jgi:parallel beta-helix repeat protein
LAHTLTLKSYDVPMEDLSVRVISRLNHFRLGERKLLKRTVSGIMLTLLIISMVTLAFNIQPAKASGTIYIRADGSIDPPTAPIITLDNVSYTFADNVYDSIVVERDNIVVDGAGYIVQGGRNGTGLDLSGRCNVTIRDLSINMFYNYGIRLASSFNNTISGNQIAATNDYGIYVWCSSHNSIYGNNATANSDGIYLWGSSENSIYRNNITANRNQGIMLNNSPNNTIAGNNITANNGDGIWLGYSSNNNSIHGNNITANGEGTYIWYSSSNIFHHNNFIDNAKQVGNWYSNNTWDDGYPSGGNYWSDYNGTDMYSGAYQNETGSDNIGDTPYVIDANNTDNYPLMNPWVQYENGTIYIHPDGSVEPSGGPILRKGNLYTLTSNITSNADGIVIDRDNITLDGAGYTLLGSGMVGNGIGLTSRSNVTIKDCHISEFGYGIYLYSSSNNSIVENNIEDNSKGICLDTSLNNTISGNNVTENIYEGIWLDDSSNNNIVAGNNIENNQRGIWIDGSSNRVSGNNIIGNMGFGILLYGSSNTVSANNVTENTYNGILLEGSSNNIVVGNNVIGNMNIGIWLDGASNNNIIVENNIEDNQRGIYLWGSSNNIFYHNNFIGNIRQVDGQEGPNVNVWDDGYPSGGNYWSNYNGSDFYSGPYQNITGSDGIGDTPYTIDVNNTDRYPLMKSYIEIHDIAVTHIAPSKSVVGQGYSLDINVIVANQGDYTETFNVTAYANTTVIGTLTVNNMPNVTSTVLTFTWNTTGFAKGNYTVSAVADTLLGETDTVDNTFTDGWVVVAIIGDITGPAGYPDGKCDMRDVGLVARHFGENVPPAPPECDITGPTGVPDGKVDMRDIGLVARHFGETDP